MSGYEIDDSALLAALAVSVDEVAIDARLEAVLELRDGVEAEVDELLATSGPAGRYSRRERSTASRTPAPMAGSNRYRTPTTPAKTRATESPVTVKKERGETEAEPDSVRSARKVREILEEVLPKWKALVAQKAGKPPRKGLDRFESGGSSPSCEIAMLLSERRGP